MICLLGFIFVHFHDLHRDVTPQQTSALMLRVSTKDGLAVNLNLESLFDVYSSWQAVLAETFFWLHEDFSCGFLVGCRIYGII